MSFALDGPVLEGALVRLEPLAHRHAADLAASAEEDRSAYGFTWVPRADEVEGYIDMQQLLGGLQHVHRVGGPQLTDRGAAALRVGFVPHAT